MQRSHRLTKSLPVILLWPCLLPVLGHAQTASPDHSVHHGTQNANVKPRASPSPGPSPDGMGMMQDEESMQRMMEQRPSPPKELYPSLMDFPNVLPERRVEIERLAHQRMEAGRTAMSTALEKLSNASAKEDYATMQEATAQLRAALAQYESGLAAHRALAEGKVPRNVALAWFKREMNLFPLATQETPHGLFGLSWFHYVVMLMLAVFVVTMISMYFHKMRRAEVLIAQLTRGGSPPINETVKAGTASEPTSPPLNKPLREPTTEA